MLGATWRIFKMQILTQQVGVGWEGVLRFRSSNSVTGDADVAGPWTTFQVAMG